MRSKQIAIKIYNIKMVLSDIWAIFLKFEIFGELLKLLEKCKTWLKVIWIIFTLFVRWRIIFLKKASKTSICVLKYFLVFIREIIEFHPFYRRKPRKFKAHVPRKKGKLGDNNNANRFWRPSNAKSI